MKSKSRENKGAQSSYVKYDKAPYPYQNKGCSHKTLVQQSTPLWSGKVCSVCNIIVETFQR